MNIETIKAMRVTEAIAAVEAFTGMRVTKRSKKAAAECLRKHILRTARFENKISERRISNLPAPAAVETIKQIVLRAREREILT